MVSFKAPCIFALYYHKWWVILYSGLTCKLSEFLGLTSEMPGEAWVLYFFNSSSVNSNVWPGLRTMKNHQKL